MFKNTYTINHNLTLAQAAMDGANGINIDGRNIRVSFHSENPQGGGGGGGYGGGDGYGGRREGGGGGYGGSRDRDGGDRRGGGGWERRGGNRY